MTNFSIKDIKPADIFGNDSADLEDVNIFNSYAFRRKEFTRISSVKEKLLILMAYKGEGKSAFLVMLKNSLKTTGNTIVVGLAGSEVVPKSDSFDTDVWSREWKKSILNAIASEIGSKINIAWSDDATGLVEMAEKNGYKSRSFVGYVVDRIKSRYVEVSKVDVGNKMIEKWLSNSETKVWLIIDDVDKNFRNEMLFKAKISGFFDAIKSLMVSIPELVIRCTIRPNVWTIIANQSESLSHVRQYLIPVQWNEDDIRILIAYRIKAFMDRNLIKDEVIESIVDDKEKQLALIRLVFRDPMRWGDKEKSPHTIIATLARFRPRWMVELCKLAIVQAQKKNNGKIYLDNIIDVIPGFGSSRIQDTNAEFISQCPEIDELIAAFKHQEKTYNTQQLSDLIKDKILQHLTPHISGITGKPSVNEVAHFLYQIGFVSARRDHMDGSYEHITYAQDPTILKARSNLHDGLNWEIHPVFVEALEMTNNRKARSFMHER